MRRLTCVFVCLCVCVLVRAQNPIYSSSIQTFARALLFVSVREATRWSQQRRGAKRHYYLDYNDIVNLMLRVSAAAAAA